MEVEQVKKINSWKSKICKNYRETAPIQTMPLEIIAKIVKHLSLKDVLSLAAVSKIWRSVYLNQNIIWKDICLNLSIHEDDFINCATEKSQHRAPKLYVDTKSEYHFGKLCNWWLTYVRYNMVLKNILHSEYPVIRIKRQQVEHTYCTDDYIINIFRVKSNITIEAVIIENALIGEQYIERKDILNFELFETWYNKENFSLNITGNKKFLVLEIRSVIFVYKIDKRKFIPEFWKTIQKAADYNPENDDKLPNLEFYDDKQDTKIDLWEDRLALIHPNDNVIFLVDLTRKVISKELIYSSIICTVDCMKCAEERLMIGISYKDPDTPEIEEYSGILYHFDNKPTENKKFTISLKGAVTQFKVTKNYIGIENRAPATPFITKITNLIHIFWIDCDTFSFDNTRKFIYYNVNRSLFKYDLNKSRLDRFEVVEKIANDAISINFSLTPINDRFLFICSALSNSYDVFDVACHHSIRSFVFPGYMLAHVGKLAVVFYNSKEFIIIRFY